MLPRFIVAGARSGTGKTTVATGIMGALARAGLKVQPFKVGPDYIDTGYHSLATGRQSINLDPWLTSERGTLETLVEGGSGAEFAVVEGAMGLYDGVTGQGSWGSTAHISRLTSTPVLLVLDSRKMGYSAGALVKGYQSFEGVDLKGVILNHVGSSTHEEILRQGVEKAGASVLGAIPREKGITLPERHLGLVPALEKGEFSSTVKKITSLVEEHVDLEGVMEIARSPVDLPSFPISRNQEPRVKVAVARDAAFSFYYWDNLELLRREGAELEFFSPLEEEPPGCDGVYLGGGFPEVFASQLSKSPSRKKLMSLFEDEVPIYAECGGLMFLCREIRALEGGSEKSFPMVGAFSATVEMTRKLQALRYTLATVSRRNPYLGKGTKVKGHEFHYSRITDLSRDQKYLYSLQRGSGISDFRDGLIENNALASYMHLNFRGEREFPKNFVTACLRHSKK